MGGYVRVDTIKIKTLKVNCHEQVVKATLFGMYGQIDEMK